MFIVFRNKCPVCGTKGKVWHKRPRVFVCPHCLTIYSNYGIVLESDYEEENLWN